MSGHLHLRPATPADMHLVFTWRNRPEIIALGTTQRAVEWEEHQRWFEKKLQDESRLFMIVLLDDKPIGQVRFDPLNQDSCAVSIYLLPEHTGRGLGVMALKPACRRAFARMPVKEIVAFIREDNPRSASAFRKAGFEGSSPAGSNSLEGHFALSIKRPPDVPHNRLTYGAAETEAVVRTVNSGYWASGPRVRDLENTLARLAGVEHAVCVASGLGALRLVLKAVGIQAGDKVLIPAYSCVALANAALACGAAPVAADITHSDWNLDAAGSEPLVKEHRLRAVIAVHTFGSPAAIGRMMDWGVPVIEDCAHGFGISIDRKPLGSRAHAAVLSFYATKLIGAGEGGAILTNSGEIAHFTRSWRDYSDQPPDGTRLNDKMTDLEATLALCQLERLKENIAARQRLAERYNEMLAPAQDRNIFRLPDIGAARVWYRYAVEMIQAPAKDIIERLQRFGVQATDPVTDWRAGHEPSCPVADHAYRSLVSLPLYPTLSVEEQDRVIDAFLQVSR